MRCAPFLEVRCPTECCKQTSSGLIGLPVPAIASAFRPGLARFSRLPSTPALKPGLHPPASFAPPSKSYGRQPALEDLAALRVRLPWSFFPHRDLGYRQATPRFPTRGYVPSPAFRTPSTVYSANTFAGLFHPAATSRVRPSGVCSSTRSRTSFHWPLPSCRLSEKRLRFDPRQHPSPRLQGLAPRDECGVE